jgi:hypothetical protein
MDLFAIVETVFFDFALIGSLAALVATVVARLILRPRAAVAGIFADSVEALRRRIGEIKAPDAVLIAVLVVVAGITLNGVADEAFDGGVPGLSWFFHERTGGQEQLAGCSPIPVRGFRLRTEDQIKQDVVRDVCAGAGHDSPAERFLIQHSTYEGAKQVVQIAMATVLESGSAAANTALRVEFIAVKLARAFALLSAVFVLGVTIRMVWAMLRMAALRRAIRRSAHVRVPAAVGADAGAGDSLISIQGTLERYLAEVMRSAAAESSRDDFVFE